MEIKNSKNGKNISNNFFCFSILIDNKNPSNNDINAIIAKIKQDIDQKSM